MEKKKHHWLLCGLLLTAVGFLLIPKATSEISNKTYKKEVDTRDINFEDMGPEIVRKDKDE